MPVYTYTCGRHEREVVRSMLEDAGQEPPCLICGAPMRRRYKVPGINWGGLKPSDAARRPSEIDKFIESAPERRDAFEKEHEEHEHRTA